MKRGTIWAVGWVLFGLLAFSTVLLVLGSRERYTMPSALSYGPSGTHALVELLRQEGFDVVIERSSRPKLLPEDLVLGFAVYETRNPFSGERPGSESPVEKSLRRHLQSGGRAMLLQVPDSFIDATRTASTGPREASFVVGKAEKTFRVTRGDSSPLYIEDAIYKVSSRGYEVVADAEENTLAALFQEGDGLLGILFDGTAGTNRFIDQEDNATFLLRLIGMLAPDRARVVFLDAFNAPPVEAGLLATIGPWASAAWWQLILLFIVIAYSLGRRFGLPENLRYHQRGGKELMEAYADVMQRARMPHVALKMAVQEADREVRRKYSISAELPPKRRNESLPPKLAEALSRAELASASPLPEPAAAGLMRALQDAMSGIAEEPKRRRRKRA